MERSHKNGTLFDFKKAKESIDMKDYLAKLGFQPTKHPSPHEYWYHSPLSPDGDKTPSFKIATIHGRQVWYDHSRGTGGDLIDFGIQFHRCSHRELLQKFSDFLSFHPQPTSEKSLSKKAENENIVEAERKIIIVGERPIYKFYLKNYLQERCIPLELANKYVTEIDFLNKSAKDPNNVFTALGFKNDKGGYELRSKFFKGSSMPKATTFIPNLSPDALNHKPRKEQSIAVIEGFFSFMSFEALRFQNKLDTPPPDNYLILNSLSFFQNSFAFIETFGNKMLFLDNGTSGRNATAEAMDRKKNYTDYAHLYGGHDDLNKFLVAIHRPMETEKAYRIKR